MAAYSGDTNNNPNTTTCGDTNETVTVSALPQIAVTESADPPSQPAPGGTFTFTVTVSHPGSTVQVTITALDDSVYGQLASRAGSTCGTLVSTTLAPGASAPCTFSGTFTGVSGASQTDTLTVTGADSSGNVAHASAQATVTITAAPAPQMKISESAQPAVRPAPGGNFTFTVAFSNPSATDPVTISSLVDSVYGDLGTRSSSSCHGLIGATLAPNTTSMTCAFTGPFTGPSSATQTDTVTATGADASGHAVVATGQAMVMLTALTSQIGVTANANPRTLPEPGGAFSFTLAVSNLSTNPVTITAVTDTIYGNLATRTNSTCTALIGLTIAPAETSPCSFVGMLTGPQGTMQNATVMVAGKDGQGVAVSATAQTLVAITAAGVAPGGGITGLGGVTGGGQSGTPVKGGSPLAFTGFNDRSVPMALALILIGLVLVVASHRRRDVL